MLSAIALKIIITLGLFLVALLISIISSILFDEDKSDESILKRSAKDAKSAMDEIYNFKS